jgi:hypothetical protein
MDTGMYTKGYLVSSYSIVIVATDMLKNILSVRTSSASYLVDTDNY